MSYILDMMRAAAELMGWLVIWLVALGLFIKYFGDNDD